jgi:DNA-binding response OmpR family regulator
MVRCCDYMRRSWVARILVVDDDEGIRSFLKRKLGQAGHDVSAAESGVAASQLMRESHFDLAITDIIMPEKDGLETIIELRATKCPSMKIIAMSGGGIGLAKDYLHVARQLGADATIAKPFDFEDLLNIISSLV